MSKKSKEKSAATPIGTQKFLSVEEIKDGLLFLKDGSVHKILKAESLNFYLRSEEEQAVIIGGFQEVLNTLNFPIQILLQSRKIDLGKYLETIRKNIDDEEDPLIKANTEDYLGFLQKMIVSSSVMDKNFYIIVSYYPAVINKSVLDKLFGSSKKVTGDQALIDSLESLAQRCSSIVMSLRNIEVECRELQTKEIVELFYQTYNQDVARLEMTYGETDQY